MKKIVTLIVVFLFPFLALAQQKIGITLTARVDTNDKEVTQILRLWQNYLNSRPDSLYDNPYWNSKEKKKYLAVNLHFDRSSWIIYQGTNAFNVLQIYKPRVLAIEKEYDKYYIQTLYYGENMEPKFAQHNPPWMTRHYAVKEKGEWKLENSINSVTRDWKAYQTQFVMFVCSPNHVYSPSKAQAANLFIDSVISVFKLHPAQPFEYYITHSLDEFCKLYNLDFWLHHSESIAHWPLRQICTSTDNEYNTHEFVHMIFGATKHWMISEGLATWLGGTGIDGNSDFNVDMVNFAEEINDNVTITFNDIYSRKYYHKKDNLPLFVIGGYIVKLTYEKNGIEGVKNLLNDNTEDIYELISKHTGISKDDIDFKLVDGIKKYAKK